MKRKRRGTRAWQILLVLCAKGVAGGAITDSAAAAHHIRRGVAAMHGAGGANEAAEHFRAGLKLDPGNADSWRRLGAALLRKGDGAGSVGRRVLDRARQCMEHAARLDRVQGNSTRVATVAGGRRLPVCVASR